MGLSFVTCVMLIIGQFSAVDKVVVPNDSFTVKTVVSSGAKNDTDGWVLLDTNKGIVLLIHGNEDGKVSGVINKDNMLIDDAVNELNARYKTVIVKVFCCYPKRVAATSKSKVNIAYPDHDDVVYMVGKQPKGQPCVFNVYTENPN